MRWRVTVEALAPENDEIAENDPRIEVFEKWLEQYSGVVAFQPKSWFAVISIESSAEQIDYVGASAVVNAATEAGLARGWSLVRIEYLEESIADAELEEPPFPNIVGPGEVLEILGISKQRLHQLRVADRFPLPMLELMSGPIWMRAAVEMFKEIERPAGRPVRGLSVEPVSSAWRRSSKADGGYVRVRLNRAKGKTPRSNSNKGVETGSQKRG